jgi:hypothetical protein
VIAAFSGIATLAFVVVSAGVGVRLLWLARRTRAVPELALGVAFFAVGAIGYPIGLLAILPGTPELPARALFALANLATGLGSAAVFVFTRSVFRPDSRWAGALVVAASAVLAVQVAFGVARALTASPASFAEADFGFSVRQAVTALSYGWTALEALRYRALLVRRLALGLADVVVVNRFLLWAIAGGGAFFGSSVMSTVSLTGATPWEDPVALLAVGLGGFVAAICTGLAFLPPRAYRVWLEGRAA